MQDMDAFVKQFPYPLIPTNIPGAFASPALPEELDVEAASPATLAAHGLQVPRAAANGDPAVAASWKEFLAHRWRPQDRIVPVLEPQPGRTHLLRRLKRANTDILDSNWAGGVLQATGTPAFNFAQGRWHIPAVSKPDEQPGTEGGWNSSSWVGLDGADGSNDVLQAGIQQRVDGSGQPSYVAWYEWFAPSQQGSPPYIFQTNIANFPVNPGDQVFCSAQYINNKTAGLILFSNETTGKHFTITLAPPPGATFSGNCIEWIMEAPDGGEPTAALPAFTPVQFGNAFGGNNSTLSLVPVIGHAQNGDVFNVQNGGNTLTSVALGQDSVLIRFIADDIQVRFRNATSQTVFFDLNGGAGLNTSLPPAGASGYDMVTSPGLTPAVAIRQNNGSILSFSVSNGGAYVFRLDGGAIKNFFDT